eukprot:UN27976
MSKNLERKKLSNMSESVRNIMSHDQKQIWDLNKSHEGHLKKTSLSPNL